MVLLYVDYRYKSMKIYMIPEKLIFNGFLKIGGLQLLLIMIEYLLSSGSGGMADALDSGSSGS